MPTGRPALHARRPPSRPLTPRSSGRPTQRPSTPHSRTERKERPHHSHIAPLPKIHPKLHLTSVDGAKKQTGQIAILAVATPETTNYMKGHKGAAYRAFVRADDTESMSEDEFIEVFTKASDLLDVQLRDPHKNAVYVHCYAGINRSVCTIMSWVVRYTNLDPEKVLNYIERVNLDVRGMETLTNRRFRQLLPKLSRANTARSAARK